MSKELKNTTSDIMNRIHKGGYKMRPRSYFIIISALVATGLVISVLVSVFSVSLTRFALRGYGSLVKPQAEVFTLGFPWWILVVAIVSLLLGMFLIRRYDFSYRHKLWIVSALLAISTFAIGWGVDAAKLDETVVGHTSIQKIMKQYQYKYENGIKEKQQKKQTQQKQVQTQKESLEMQRSEDGNNEFQNQFQEQNQNQIQNIAGGADNSTQNIQSGQENQQSGQGAQNIQGQGTSQESGSTNIQKKGR